MSPHEGIAVEVDSDVCTITFDRPEARNALTGPMFEAYCAALAEADADPAVRAIVITGRGDWFCTGAAPEALGALLDPEAREGASVEAAHPPELPLTLRKPLIAAVNGGAAGLGLVQALHADIRFLAAEARLSTSFSRLGLVAEYGSAWLLPRLVGRATALDLLLSARKVDAAEALRIGLVQRVLPREQVLPAAMAYARDLVEHCSPAAMATIKAQVWAAADSGPREAFAEATRLMVESFARPDFVEGVTASRDRRTPKFPPLT
ncbi:enoyl-CoA hydratase-related protein [Umezawaea sp. Da 62-37]|uniref:enoyl-CoA hydratase-related protein n=1 Tax=Umezawaea sp. Da 62-37 TaxID=3075927 RepID=UPI0028F706E5|nr:enoyl-CoA hydratase-related protein [Umezawaea sp. Da 62-37]WNV88377.1 enoyl-CoA hydratase-related protein [Umezawaea sp. Da 62-37]